MIFYYSATGNTKWMAERIAEKLNDQVVDIMNADPEDYHFSKEDMVGIAFPVFACTAPPHVSEFAKKLDVNGAYTYVVCDYSNLTGHTLQNFSRDILHLNSGYGLLMPDNTSVLGFTYDNEESTIKKMETAVERLDKIIERLKTKEEGVFDSYEGPDPDAMDSLPEIFFGSRATAEPFCVDKEKCISCGLCEKKCPAKVIKLDENKIPVWTKPLCYQCSACINNCPVEAIEFGDVSKGVKRYNFRKYRQYLNEDYKK